ncbi:MAG: hypothetical protein ACK49Q_05885 [Burkholderiales bacterium]
MFNRHPTWGAILPFKQDAINTVQRGARHQANVVLQVLWGPSFTGACERGGEWRKRGRGGGQPGPCQR